MKQILGCRALAGLLVVMAALITGCSSTEVRRVDATEQVDIGGDWNDTDSRLVSDAMVADALGRPWLAKYREANGGRNPVVIVGDIRKFTQEHVNVRTFVKDLERALVNSGEVDFVASSEERGDVREERKDQAVFASEDTAKEHGMETGADFMLQGSINSIIQQEGRESVKFYQVNMEMIDLQSNRKAWIGEKKIKKLVTRKKFGL